MFIIFGPTGVGKTDLALRIAEYIPAEIINMDIGQFYTPLSIGTAKPNWQISSIPHHLFDIINKPENITVVVYRDMVLTALDLIWSKKKIPIIVGGSGFYLHSLFFPPRATKINNRLQNYPIYTTDWWKILKKIDPVRASQIGKNDTYRIKRALQIWDSTGCLPSNLTPLFKPVSDYFLLFVTREKDDLYSRINKRVTQMIENGWIGEVEQLKKTHWAPFIKKKIIGYDTILQYLEKNQNKQNLDTTINIIQKRTRNYAKRQNTFWRMFRKKLEKSSNNSRKLGHIESVNLTFDDPHLYAKMLLKNYALLKNF